MEGTLQPIVRRRGDRDEDEGEDWAGGEGGPSKVSCVAINVQAAAMDEGGRDDEEEESIEAEGGTAESMTPAAMDADQGGDEAGNEPITIACNVHGCKVVCQGVAEYESHYSSAHSFTCHECRRSFPNERLMDRHITERHDPFFSVLSERQPMYECLVEGCGGVFKDEHARSMHLSDKHKYPKGFDYDGMARRRHSPSKPHYRGGGLGGLSLAAKANANREKQLRQHHHEEQQDGEMMAVEGEGGEAAAVSSEAGPSSSSSSLSAKKKVKCVYFNLPGGCRRGEACHFKHVPREHHHDHEGGHEEAGAAAMGGGDEEEGMAVDDLSHALHSKLRLPQTISFGRKMQDHRK